MRPSTGYTHCGSLDGGISPDLARLVGDDTFFVGLYTIMSGFTESDVNETTHGSASLVDGLSPSIGVVAGLSSLLEAERFCVL